MLPHNNLCQLNFKEVYRALHTYAHTHTHTKTLVFFRKVTFVGTTL